MLSIYPCSCDDIAELAILNHMLIEDEKAENNMDSRELRNRMAEFLRTDYKAFFFVKNSAHIGYALVNTQVSPIYLRQFFICREHRKRGYGRKAFNTLLEHLQIKEIDIDVCAWNQGGMSFWKALGFEVRYHGMRLK